MMKKIIGILVILVVLGGVWVGYFIGQSKTKERPVVASPRQVPVIKLAPQEITQTQDYIGFIQTPKKVEITPNIAGYVVQVFVQGGESVKKGDPLFILDQRALLAQLNSAIADRLQAEAKLENAKSYLKRLRKTPQQAISATNLDTAKADYKTARGAVMAARAQQKQAETNLAYTYLSAPFDGILGDVSIVVGDYVSPEKGLALLVKTSPVRVQFALPFADKGILPELKKAKISLLSTQGQPLLTQGKIVFTDNQITPTTDSLTIYADFQNPQNEVLGGAAVFVHFEQNYQGILIPKNTVQQTPKGNFAFLLQDGKIKNIPLSITDSIGENYWIETGLKAGDLLITAPLTQKEVGQTATGVFK